MKADTWTLKDIFGKDIRFLVPMFQRPYVWNEEEHWGPLWDDVVAVAERLLDELDIIGPNQVAKAEQNTPPHFLGAVVVDQQQVPVAEFDARHVIDGQQRLTTLQVLIDAAQEVVLEWGEAMEAKQLAKLVQNDLDLAAHPDHVFKVWPTNVDRDAFRAAMSGTGMPKALADQAIARAHVFFIGAIREWVGVGEDPDKRAGRLSALTTSLRGLLRLVVIDLEPQDNAQVIFETLNARGTPLLASDLVKNLLFQAANQDNAAKLEYLYDAYWRRFDTPTWRREVRQGRLKRPRIDVFLFHWLVMRLGKEFTVHQLYPTFRSHLRAGADPLELMADLSRYGDVYDGLDQYAWTSPEGTFAYRWRVMEQSVFTPLILWLLGKPEDDLDTSGRRLALQSLESWMVRRMLCRLTAKDYNRFLLDFLSHLESKPPSDAGRVATDFLAGQTAETRLWPTNDQVRRELIETPVYRRLSQGRLRFVLEAIEDALRTSKSEEDHAPRGKLTIEHIMPQKWELNWELGELEDADLATANRNQMIHTLGNLTLVNEHLNPLLSNAKWDVKRQGFQKHSVLYLNKRLLAGWPDHWDENTIIQRGHELVDAVLETWPRPAE